MDYITTASGKKYAVSSFSQTKNPDQLYIRISGESLGSVAEEFDNPMNIQTISYNNDSYAGYTKLVVIVPEPQCIRVVLEKE